jgi:hypothetical protein
MQPRHPRDLQPGRQAPPRKEPSIRKDLVARIRQEIAEGIYDTPEKMARALERLLENLKE